MLEHEEMLRLIKEAQSGSEKAKESLVENNIPLVKSIVKRYRGKYIEYEDLLQLGLLGLVKAINNFDSNFNVRFSTYAVPMIAGEIKRFIRDDGAIKVSRALKTMSYKISRFTETFMQENNREATVSDIAKHLNIEESEVVYTMDSSKMPVSLYDKVDNDNGKSLIDKLVDPVSHDDMMDRLLVKELIAKLPDREKKLILLRYYADKTQTEVAKELGVSQVQISRLETKIVEKLKKAML